MKKNKIKHIDIPLVKGKKSDFPDEAKCPWCKKNKVLEPHSFAGILGGALLTDENDETSAGPSKRMMGFLNLFWHGAHSDEGGQGISPDTEGHIILADEVIGGQYGFYFCSPGCLREFLNSCIDKLEKQIKK